MALATGLPVARSHKIVVSRWFVIPRAAISVAVTPRVRSRRGDDSCLARPDIFGGMLYPARLRVSLRKVLLFDAADRACRIEENGPRAGRTLVDSENILFHRNMLFGRTWRGSTDNENRVERIRDCWWSIRRRDMVILRPTPGGMRICRIPIVYGVGRRYLLTV